MASEKPVFQKLGLKSTHKAAKLTIPREFEKMLGETGVKFSRTLAEGDFDFILGFYESQKELKGDLPKIKRALAKKTGMAWVCWRKGNITDLSRDGIRSLVEGTGLDTVASCSINDDWSSLKLMYPKAERT